MTRHTRADRDLAALLADASPDVAAANAATLTALRAEVAAALAPLMQAGALGGARVEPPQRAAQSIVLPLPPSTNDNWVNYNGRTVLSEAAKNFRAGVKLRANLEDIRPFDGNVAVYVHVYRANAAQDLDNYDGKALLDALQGVMFHNDNQVVERHSWRHDDKANPRVEVEVRTVNV